jgi:hypothetical protein
VRRLAAARDRELRHVVAQLVSWRWSDTKGGWYPWCRVCCRDAGKQVNWLIGAKYVEPAKAYAATVNVQPVDSNVKPYLERYPR